MTDRLRLPVRKRRPALFDGESLYAGDTKALQRDWDFLQARYEHLPEFRELVRRYLDGHH
jgi:hypothetical protein